MNYSRTLTPVCSLLATALLAFAQTPTPRAAAAPPAPPDAWEQTPTPAPAPRPALAPMAPMAPMPPMPPMELITPAAAMAAMDIDLGDLDAQIAMAKELTMSPELQDQIAAAKEMAGRMKLDLQGQAFDMAAATDMLRGALAFAPQAVTPRPPIPPMQ